MDYSKLSDAELRALIAQPQSTNTTGGTDYSSMSDEQLMSIIGGQPQQKVGRGGILPSFAESFATGITDVPGGIADLFGAMGVVKDPESTRAYKFSQAARPAIQEALGIDPTAEATTAETAASALGSVGSFILPGLGAAKGAKALGAGARGASIAGKVSAAGQGAALGAAEQSARIKAREAAGEAVSEDDKNAAILAGGAIGLSEIATIDRYLGPLEAILKKVPLSKAGSVAGKVEDGLKRALVSATAEGAQEAIAQLAQNLVEQGYYNPDLDVTEGLLSNAAAGGFAGGTLDVVLQLVAGRKARNLEVGRQQLQKNILQQAQEKAPEAVRADAVSGLETLRSSRPEGEIRIQKGATTGGEVYNVVDKAGKVHATFRSQDAAYLAAEQYGQDFKSKVKFVPPTVGKAATKAGEKPTTAEKKQGKKLAKALKAEGALEPAPIETPTTEAGQAETLKTLDELSSTPAEAVEIASPATNPIKEPVGNEPVVPEAPETLAAQRKAVRTGKRKAMLYTPQDKKPIIKGKNIKRISFDDGSVIDFNPSLITEEQIRDSARRGRLNDILDLGPYTKGDVLESMSQGNVPVGVVERTPEGTEVKAAVGTEETAPEQVQALEATKTAPENTVQVEDASALVQGRQDSFSGQAAKFDKISERIESLALNDEPKAKYRPVIKKAVKDGLMTQGQANSLEYIFKDKDFTGDDIQSELSSILEGNYQDFVSGTSRGRKLAPVSPSEAPPAAVSGKKAGKAPRTYKPSIRALFEPLANTKDGKQKLQAFEAKKAEVAKKLNERLSPIVGKNVRVKLENVLKSGDQFAEGYVEAGDVIFLSYSIYDPNLTVDQMVDKLMDVANHELVHSLVNLGILKPGEVKSLFNAADKMKYRGNKFSYYDRAFATYSRMPEYQKNGVPNEEMIREEAVAEMFRDYRAKKLKLGGNAQNAVQRVINFFKRMFGGFNDAGVGKLFKQIESGGLAGRETKATPALAKKLSVVASKDPRRRILEPWFKKFQEGSITREEWNQKVQELKPVTAYPEMPRAPQLEEVRDAIGAKGEAKGVDRIGLAHRILRTGDRVTSRLDIPAYDNNGVWVETIRSVDGKFEGASYDRAGMLTNVVFDVNQRPAEKVAAGENDKSPFAVIEGDWVEATPEQIQAVADEVFNNPEWRQVGMDPTRHSYFYDRKTMEPVVSASEVIQIGPMVLARNAKTASDSEFKFSVLPDVNSEEFKRWWKRSQATDPRTGEPQVYYHGRPRPLREGQFDRAASGSLPGEEGPYYFSPASWFADQYAESYLNKGGDRSRSETGTMYPVMLSVQNPFDYANSSQVDDVIDYIANGLESGEIDQNDLYAIKIGNPSPTSLKRIGMYLERGDWDVLEIPAVQRAIRGLGFDGFYLVEEGVRNLAVYNSQQVKSIFNTFEPGTAESRKLSILPDFTVDNPAYVRDVNERGTAKSAIANVVSADDADDVFSRLDRASAEVSDPLESPQAWIDRLSVAYNENEGLIMPPEWLIGMSNDVPRWAQWMQLTPDQLATVDEGFNLVSRLNNAYKNGTANTQLTGNLFLWVYLSRMASAFPHESGYLDVAEKAAPFIQKMIDGTFTADNSLMAMTATGESAKEAKKNAGFAEGALPADVAVRDRSDLDNWFLMVKDALPEQSPGNAVTNNLNSYGRDFLTSMAKTAKGSNQTRLEALHDALVSDASGREVRRLFHKLRDRDNVGFDNKILSFALLLAGKQDVVILDRIQINQKFGGGQTNKIYDSVAKAFNGPRGLAVYEALEDGINQKVGELYQMLGRPQDGTTGRLHWESWIRSSGQEVAHPTIEALVKLAEGKADPFIDIASREGRFHRSMFGVQYIRRKGGGSEFVYTTRKGGEFAFTKEGINAILDPAKMKKEKITPPWFPGVSQFEGGSISWRDYPGVDIGKIELAVSQKGKPLNAIAKQQKSAFKSDAVKAALAAGSPGRASIAADAANRIRWEFGRKPDGAANNVKIPNAFERGSGGDVSGNVVAEYRLKDGAAKILADAGVSTPVFQELQKTEENAQKFYDSISAAKQSSKAGAAVLLYDVADYEGMRLFLTEDGFTGFALKEDGDIVSVFNNPAAKRPFASISMLQLAIQEGGRKLDAFDTILPHLYAQNGMTVASRLKFSENQKPDNWDYDTFSAFNGGSPDVVMMVFNPESWVPYKSTDGVLVHTGTSRKQEDADYDEAVRIQAESMFDEAEYTQRKKTEAEHKAKKKAEKDAQKAIEAKQAEEAVKANAKKANEIASRVKAVEKTNPDNAAALADPANALVRDSIKKLSPIPNTIPMPPDMAAANENIFAAKYVPTSPGERLMSLFGGLGSREGWSNLFDTLRVHYVHSGGRIESLERQAFLEGIGGRTEEQSMMAEYSAIAARDMAARASHYGVEIGYNGAPVVMGLDANGKEVPISQAADPNSAYVTVPQDQANSPFTILDMIMRGGPNGEALVEQFRSYAIAQVSKRRLSEGKDIPQDITPEYIEAADKLAEQYPVLEKAFKRYQEFNTKLLEAARDSGYLSQDLFEQFTDDQNYYSMYRQLEEAEVPVVGGGFAPKIRFKAYEGSTSGNLMADPVVAMMHNVMFWNGAIMKTIASRKAFELGKDMGIIKTLRSYEDADGNVVKEQPAVDSGFDPRVFTTYINGKEVRFATTDPLFATGLASNASQNSGMALELLGMPAQFLREMVTRDPGFMVANLLRDSISTWVVAGSGASPFDTFRGAKKALMQDSSFKALKSFGVVGSFDEAQKSARQLVGSMQRKIATAQGATDIMDKVKNGLDKLERVSEASDAATRIAVYDAAKRDGASDFTAAYRALSIMNFSRSGASAGLKIATRLIPFLNARIQGFDVLYTGLKAGVRTATGAEQTALERQRGTHVLYRSMGLVAASLALAMLNGDDEDYKQLPQYIKDGNVLIPTGGGQFISIPKPFEAGFLFMTVPTTMYELTKGDRSARSAMKLFGGQFSGTFGFNPIPQALLPLAENWFNYDMYTGQPLISEGMRRVDPSLQYNASTTYVARGLSKVSEWLPVNYNSDTGRFEAISPILIDNLISGYGGPIGSYIAMGVGGITSAFGQDNEGLPVAASNMPVVRRFFVDAQDKQPQAAAEAYELYQMVDRVNRTMSRLKQSGDREALREYRQENIDILRAGKQIQNMSKNLNSIRAQIRRLEADTTMDSAQKLQKMRELRARQLTVTRNIEKINQRLGR